MSIFKARKPHFVLNLQSASAFTISQITVLGRSWGWMSAIVCSRPWWPFPFYGNGEINIKITLAYLKVSEKSLVFVIICAPGAVAFSWEITHFLLFMAPHGVFYSCYALFKFRILPPPFYDILSHVKFHKWRVQRHFPSCVTQAVLQTCDVSCEGSKQVPVSEEWKTKAKCTWWNMK